MRKRSTVFYLALCVALLGYAPRQLFAEGNDVEEATEHTEGNQSLIEDFYPGNPYTREMYGGYQRNGNFKLWKENGTVLNATRLRVTWEQSSTAQYFLVNGKEVKRGSKDISREVSEYTPQTFVLKKDMNLVYSEPFDDKVIKGKTVKAGRYITSASSMDFVQIHLDDGSKVWINSQYTPYFEPTSNGYFESTVGVLKDKTINGVPVHQMMMKVSESTRTGIPMRPKYVTIHNTGNKDSGADAKKHAELQFNQNRQYVSWHYTVDNKEIYQSMPMNEVGWHAGDGLYSGNGSSIGIEICENSDGNYAQAEKNAAILAAHILYENGLPADAIRMHYDWSGKDCPYNIIHYKKGSMGWNKFKETVAVEYNRLVKENEVQEEIPEALKNKITEMNLKLDQNYITGVTLGKNAQEAVVGIENYEEGASVSVEKADGTSANDQLVATGQKIVVKDVAGKTYKLTVVLKGDVNGDGKIQATDYVKIKNKIMDKGTLSGAYLKAADVNNDGKIFATDYVKIKNHIMGKGQISQK